jgi:hypothetical protein
MAYTRRNIITEGQEAQQKAEQIAAICKELHITIEPINWRKDGMQALVKVNGIEIASLLDLSQRDRDGILRQVQIKLFEHTALETIHARPGTKALMWSPVDVIQPQEFLSLWVITLETDERIPITERISHGQRVYEHYTLNISNEEQLALLFGPAAEGLFHIGEHITIKERERQYTGEVIYTIPPGKGVSNRRYGSKGFHTIAGKTYTNDVAARYIVNCNDGFPHIVHQSQVINE